MDLSKRRCLKGGAWPKASQTIARGDEPIHLLPEAVNIINASNGIEGLKFLFYQEKQGVD